nr:hypothetical protein [Tanacetum cinerariifolium]
MSSYNHFGCSYCGGPFNGGNYPSCSSVGSENEFVYDLNLNSDNDSLNFFNLPPQPHTYSCELCGNDHHYGSDYLSRFPLVYEPEPCYNQNYGDNCYPQNSQSYPRQYLCCENCGGPHETFQCQPMHQNFYNSNSFGFDQSQPPQYSNVHKPPEEISIDELKTMMQSYYEIISQRHEQAAQKEQELLEQEQAVEENQELLAEEQATNPSEPLPRDKCCKQMIMKNQINMLVNFEAEIRQPDHGRLAYRCDGCLKGEGYKFNNVA